MSFQKDVESTDGLQGQFRAGLKALKKVDRGRLSVEKPLGSVDVDGALAGLYPKASRWDYLIGQQCGGRVLLHWIEVHSADGEHNVREVERKLSWLMGWVAATPLKAYRRRLYWVSSGKCSFTSRYPRVKALAQRGVLFCGQHLSIPCRD